MAHKHFVGSILMISRMDKQSTRGIPRYAPRRYIWKEVGGDVKALMKHVQSHAERKRRFGSNWETKLYNGVVLNVTTPRPKCTQIEASYNLGNE